MNETQKNRTENSTHLVVGAAVTINESGEILIAQRRATDSQAGLWEFPGGKKEQGETIQECIKRELKEELNIDIKVGELLKIVEHDYANFTIELYTYFAKITGGKPSAIECADFAWVSKNDLKNYSFSGADNKIVDALLCLQ